MRVLTQGPSRRPLGRTILALCHVYFLLHWLTGIFMFREKLGFSPAAVTRYYLGDPERFMNPRSFQGLLEITHFHLFAMGLFFMVFTHLLLFTPLRPALQTLLTWLLFAGLSADLAAGWLVRYLHPAFSYLKLAGFWTLQGASLALLLALLAALTNPGTGDRGQTPCRAGADSGPG